MTSKDKFSFAILFLLACIQVCLYSVWGPKVQTNHVEIAVQNKTSLGDGCYHVFLDVGSHLGVHARFLFEPDKYPESKLSVAIFAKEFGRERDNRDVCVFAFEPNPKFKQRHLELEMMYKAMGWRYHPILAGASNKDGMLTFYHTHAKDLVNETGFSAVGKKNVYGGDSEPIVVPVVRLSTWIQNEIQHRHIPASPHKRHPHGPKVVMKMDIEGSEYMVFPDLITGVLCTTVHFVFGEFHQTANHHNFFPMNLTKDGKNVLELQRAWLLADSFVKMVEISENCITRIKMQDDESYSNDPVEYPKPTA